MKVIVDTSVWSLALRRDKQEPNATVDEFRRMIQDHRVQLIGRYGRRSFRAFAVDRSSKNSRNISKAFPIYQQSQKIMSLQQSILIVAVQKGYKALTLTF